MVFVLRVDSPFFSTMVLSKAGSVSLSFRRFSRKCLLFGSLG